MIYGIVGKTMAETSNVRIPGYQAPSACGNGKTNFMVYLLYNEFIKKNRRVITNFHTNFIGRPHYSTPSWSEYKHSQQIFSEWFSDTNAGSVIGITELQSLMNSAARQGKLITYIEKCLAQRRKMKFDIIWDSQELGSNDKRIRDKTDYIYRPEKWHCEYSPEYGDFRPTERCPLDECTERHLILVYQEKPLPKSIKQIFEPVTILKSWEIGKLYDTDEKMTDVLHYDEAWENIGTLDDDIDSATA